MVDWNGLFKWSMDYQDGTRPSEFKEMSKADRKWLEDALKQYTFNDVDRLGEVVESLKKQREGTAEKIENAKLQEVLDELIDLVELHPRNNVNLCMTGGMVEVLALIFSHEDAEIRRKACSVFSTCTNNNSKVQEFAAKSGALNLTKQFDVETTIQNKEAVFGALSSFIRAENFDGKRRFISEFDGLAFMIQLVTAPLDTVEKQSLRLQKKILILINDIVINDDNIFSPDPFLVRRAFAESPDLIAELVRILHEADLDDIQKLQYREYSLRILFRLHQYMDHVVGPAITPVLFAHRALLSEVIEKNEDPDKCTLFKEELVLVDECIAAPTRPYAKNYEADVPNAALTKDGVNSVGVTGGFTLAF